MPISSRPTFGFHGRTRVQFSFRHGEGRTEAGNRVRTAAAARAGRPRHVGKDRLQPAVERLQIHFRRTASRFECMLRTMASPPSLSCAIPASAYRPTNCRGFLNVFIASKTRRAGHSRDPASVLRWSRNSSNCTAVRWSPKVKSARDRRSRSASRSLRTSFRPIVSIPNRRACPRLSRAEAYVEEALSWLPQDSTTKFPVSQRDVAGPDVGGKTLQGRVLVADDNADMRAYIGRLLGAHWDVDTAEDGNAAIEAIRKNPSRSRRHRRNDART